MNGGMSDFLAMGGYARWVWSAFGFTAVILLFNVISARRRIRQAMMEVEMMDHEGNRSTGSSRS